MTPFGLVVLITIACVVLFAWNRNWAARAWAVALIVAAIVLGALYFFVFPLLLHQPTALVSGPDGCGTRDLPVDSRTLCR
jgi:hypothetical protein